METDFKLDFLYYQEKAILDAKDPKMKEYLEDISRFQDFIKNESLINVVKIICRVYLNEYAQGKYIYRGFIIDGAYKINLVYPDFVDQESDLYVAENKLSREDINYVYFKRFDDAENNSYFLKELEIGFASLQDLMGIAKGVEEELGVTEFKRFNNSEGIEFIIKDSPIASIKIGSDKFNMIINQEKWIRYFG